MTELTFYKFVTENKIEWHRHINRGAPDVIAFIPFSRIEYFKSLLSASHLMDSEVECVMKDGYFAFWMNDICDYYGVDINNVFSGEEY